MPYIKHEDRARLGLDWQAGDVPTALSAGQLNFLFSVLIKKYIFTKGQTYQTFNDIVGALEGCKLEVYRRLVGPYEDTKIKENGDVF